ncbi:MAG: NUDIX hydrolase [Desulfobacteraceae bacterium]|jgi:8-oxo-dGTP diphosphatase
MRQGNPTYPKHPRPAVGAVVFKGDRILLVKRGRPPALGQWAIPGGNIQLGESLQAAAKREILEETGITIKASKPVYTFDAIIKDDNGRIRFHYVIVDLLAEYVKGELRPGDDAADARWVAADELPALNVSAPTLKLLREKLNFGV